jgi:hypothetical protein
VSSVTPAGKRALRASPSGLVGHRRRASVATGEAIARIGDGTPRDRSAVDVAGEVNAERL